MGLCDSFWATSLILLKLADGQTDICLPNSGNRLYSKKKKKKKEKKKKKKKNPKKKKKKKKIKKKKKKKNAKINI